MPFSFLIPGYIQNWFNPGLRTGRYFSIVLGLFLLLGLWLVANRLGGKWWAAGAVWAVAINPMYSKVYSLAYSQVLVACILIWILVLVLDERASLWRIGLGSFLAGILLLTRINMVLVLPVLLVYIFWQHGTRAGTLATVVGGLTVTIGHALYWPGIMRLWAAWLPASLTPFLNTWRGIDLGSPRWNPTVSRDLRWLSFWFGIRFNFISMVALIGLGMLGLWGKAWKSAFHRRSVLFLSTLLALFVAAHAWASLGKNYCVFCYPGYLTFFSPLALLLIIITFRAWEGSKSRWFPLFASVLVLLISTGIGYSSYKETGSGLLELPVPRLKGGQFVGGSIPLWGVLEVVLGLEYQKAKVLATTFAGISAGIIVLLVGWGIYRILQTRTKSQVNLGLVVLSVFLIAGFILSPTTVLGGGYQENQCSGDIIAAHEAAGRHLAETIPPGSQVYWEGTLSAVPLLYAPYVHVYPSQINDGYAFRLGGEADELVKLGLWNAEVADRWKQESEFIVIEERRYDQDWSRFLDNGQYEELQSSPSTAPCRDDASLRIFRRISQ